MGEKLKTARIRRGWGLGLILGVLLPPGGAGGAESLPPLWGHGVKRCDAFVQAALGRERDGMAAAEFQRYQDWLSGFLSGLNLATGKDVLAGATLEVALRRIGDHCEEHRDHDVFTATMDLVRLLSSLK